MATAVLPKPAHRRSSEVQKEAPREPVRARIDNQRTEDISRFALVLMMPVVLGVMVLVIAFLLTPALQ